MSNEIKIVQTSDSNDVLRDFAKVAAAIAKSAEKLQQVAKEGRESGKQVASGANEAASAIAKIGTSYADVQRASAQSLARQKAAMQEQTKLEQQEAARKLAKQKATAIEQEKLEQAQAARSLAKQKQKALEQEKLEQQQAARSLAKQKAAALEQEKLEQAQAARSLSRQKAKALEQERIEQQAAVRSLAKQKATFQEGQRVVESTSTALEKHNMRLAKYGALLRAGAIDQQTFNRAVKQSQGELNAADSAAGSFIARLSIGALAAGGIAIAIRQARAEFDNMIERQKNAADRQVTMAGAQREAIMNLGEDMTPEEMNKRVREISKQSGATQLSVMKATSSALSFRGASSSQDAMEAVAIAAQQNPENEMAANETTKALLLLKQKNKGASFKDIAGFLIKAKQASPTVSDQAFAQNIAPAIANAGSVGTSPKEGAAFLATIGSAVGDDEGRITGTAFVDLQKQLAEVLPNVEGGSVARLKALQDPANERIKRKMLGVFGEKGKSAKKAELHGEAKTFFTLVDLISGKGETSDLLKQNLADLPDIDQAGGVFEDVQKKINAQPIQQTARLKRTVEAGVEGMQLGDLVGAQGAISRKGLEDTLKASGASKFTQSRFGLAYEAATRGGQEAPVEALAQSLRTQAYGITKDTYSYDARGQQQSSATPEMREAAKALHSVAAQLETFLKEQKQVQKVEVVNQKKPQVAPGPRPTEALAK